MVVRERFLTAVCVDLSAPLLQCLKKVLFTSLAVCF